MSELLYPGDVIRELVSLRERSEKGIELLLEAENAFAELDAEADRLESLAFLESEGTVADRGHIAKLRSVDARRDAELAKAKVSYIRTKLRHLSEQVTATQTAARMIELGFKTAGVGER